MAQTEKYQAGENYGDDKVEWTSLFSDPAKFAHQLLNDFHSIRGKASPQEIEALIKSLLNKGQPLDDKEGTTEMLIGILAALPSGSEVRTELTNKLIGTLWDTLQHPPLCYVGGDINYEVVDPSQQSGPTPLESDTIEFKVPDTDVTLREQMPQAPDGLFQYRMPDGSFNNIREPHLGRARTPYAKTVKPVKRLHGVKPDPSVLFDLLMARDENTFKENPAGISSMLFYHASIIVHDIFRTNSENSNISDTSSYLDLAPLYGSSLKDQLAVRTMKQGKLKPDTFHETRLLGQPAGVNVMLVLYSRFHNYCCDMLLQINENDRFSIKLKPNASPEDKAKALAKQDHDLFNTARLIVGGLYINISLHDYLRAITNTHHSKSDWTLDPRVAIKAFDGEGVPRGIGNQVSVEFNLLYRFHSCISKKDEKWINNFFLDLFPQKTVEDLPNISPKEFFETLGAYRASIPTDPGQRTFDKLKRQPDGRFKDEDLVRILKEAMDDPAGVFGARMVPKALKIIEVFGIIQARKWQVGSLNEFRDFFGLKRFETFTDINKSMPDIAKVLAGLYDDPDMVELYPGLMIEDYKPVRSPGCGICPTYSVGRAILSDAITLVRSDRFNTLDFNVANLTSWGYNEVQSDSKTLGGSMLYKLIQRGVPGWFPFNSVAVMQPMYTKVANERIARELGTIAQFSLEDPKPPKVPIVVSKPESIRKVLSNPASFKVPWLHAVATLFPGQRDLSFFMLVGDGAANDKNRTQMVAAMKSQPQVLPALSSLVATVGAKLIKDNAFALPPSKQCQLDLIRDVIIPLNARFLADMFYFDLKSDENPDGVLSETDLYKHLLNVRTWGVNNSDPGQAWNRRRRAQEGAKCLIDTTDKLVAEIGRERLFGIGAIAEAVGRTRHLKKGSLRSCGHEIVEEMLKQGMPHDQVVDTLWLTAFGGVASVVSAFYEVMQFFLRPENKSIWAEVQKLAKGHDDRVLHAYVVEAHRLTSTQRTLRMVAQPVEVDGQPLKPGDLVLTLVGAAGRHPEVTNASVFDHTRQSDAIKPFSTGPHGCFGRMIAPTFLTAAVKLVAGLEGLRPSPGHEEARHIVFNHEPQFLNDSWGYFTFDPSTWKVLFNA